MRTGDANPLTSRATNQPAAPPTIESGSVRPLVDALERLGYARAGLLAACGLEERQIADPDGRVPCTVFGDLVCHAQRARPRANLGLHVAQATPLGAFPLVDYLVVSCASVGEGLRNLARYYRLAAPGCELELTETEEGLRIRSSLPGEAFAEQYGTSVALLHLRRESEGRALARYVSFLHPPDDVAEFEAVLGCPVRAGAAWSGYVMSKETLALPMNRRDSILFSVLEQQAAEQLAKKPARGDIVSQVRQAIVRGLAEGCLGIDDVARELAMTSRTLQRRLADRATTFQTVLEDTRRQAAERHLRGDGLSIAEISYALGYSEPAAFHRAFRRWTGATPQTFRARGRGARSS